MYVSIHICKYVSNIFVVGGLGSRGWYSFEMFFPLIFVFVLVLLF
jgi:hypothetical protein